MDNDIFQALSRDLLKRGAKLDRLKRELERGAFDINHADARNFSLLHIAVKADNAEGVAILLASPTIDTSLRNSEGHTALMSAVIFVKLNALESLLSSGKMELDETDDEFNSIKDLVKMSKCGKDTKNKMLMMLQKQRSTADDDDVSGRHVIIVVNSKYTLESRWQELEGGPDLDGRLLVNIFEALHYTVHEINDTEDVLMSARKVMDSLDRSTIKLLHFIYTGHGGVQADIPVDQGGGIISGEVFIGITGKKTPVIHVVREVAGVGAENCRKDTKFLFFYDMCRAAVTKGFAKVRDMNFDYTEQLQQAGLGQRICQINAAQLGVEAVADNSLIQRMAQVLADTNRDCLPLKELRTFNNTKLKQQVDVKWPTMLSPDFDFHEMTFPMGGQVKEHGQVMKRDEEVKKMQAKMQLEVKEKEREKETSLQNEKKAEATNYKKGESMSQETKSDGRWQMEEGRWHKAEGEGGDATGGTNTLYYLHLTPGK